MAAGSAPGSCGRYSCSNSQNTLSRETTTFTLIAAPHTRFSQGTESRRMHSSITHPTVLVYLTTDTPADDLRGRAQAT
jgi:hypothetical protein